MQKAAIKGQKVVKKGAHSVHDLVKKYGRTFVGTYFTIYIVTLGSLFVGLSGGGGTKKTIKVSYYTWLASDTILARVIPFSP